MGSGSVLFILEMARCWIKSGGEIDFDRKEMQNQGLTCDSILILKTIAKFVLIDEKFWVINKSWRKKKKHH